MVKLREATQDTCLLLMAMMIGIQTVKADEQCQESDYYRIISLVTSQTATDSRSKNWKPAPDGLALEVSGMAFVDSQRLAVAVRKGEIWLLSGIYDDPPVQIQYQRFASGLHEPLGLLLHEGSLLTVQRSELTRLIDSDHDDVCDQYLTVAKGWGVTGNYHEYAFGPKLDGDGNLWLTLNLGLGLRPEQKTDLLTNPLLEVSQSIWRGWGMRVNADGSLEPMCAGMRSPSGLGANLDGDMFYSDQQGNWVATNSIHHLRRSAFFHHPESLASIDQPGSPISSVTEIPRNVPFPQALQQLPILKPPAVWLPYKKVGQSATDIVVDASDGEFGPFSGQLFVGEFTQSAINRVYLEKVDGEYQGVCFPFREGFASAVLRLVQGEDGSLFAGLSNRGWSSLGTASYGLQRLVWTGSMPFEMRTIQARNDGFEIEFTKPVDLQTASDPNSYNVSSHTYMYHAQYGSDEILQRTLPVKQIDVSSDRMRARLTISGLRPYFVHCIAADGIRDQDGLPLLHSTGWYTLNRIPAAIEAP